MIDLTIRGVSMAAEVPRKILEDLRQRMPLAVDTELTDGALLEQFIRHRNEESFTILMRRHGPMVWRTCRHLLGF